MQDEQTKRLREANLEKITQLRTQIDSKLISAQGRRLSIEEAMRQKLKLHVSDVAGRNLAHVVTALKHLPCAAY